MKKILLLGAGGFIGRNLSEHFNAEGKYEIFAPKSNELDLCDESSVDGYFKAHKYFDVVIHSATHNPAKENRDVADTLKATVKIFFTVKKNQDRFGKLLYMGSGAEYGKTSDLRLVSEDSFGSVLPIDDYGLAKYIISESVAEDDNIYILRLFGVFGKYEHWPSKFISCCLCKAAYDLPLSIRQNVFFDYMYIDDFFPVIDWFINNQPKYRHYNICTGTRISLKEIADYIASIDGKNLPIFVCRDGLGKEYTGSNQRIKSEMTDIRFRDIRESINSLNSWYLESIEGIDKMKLFYCSTNTK